MNNVVRFENTKRKLDWMQEEQLKSGKKREQKRRDDRKIGREVKTVGEDE